LRGSASGKRSWLACFRPRRVVLSSPYPVSECLRRRAVVTTRRGPTSWCLDPRTVGRAEPRFWGDAGPSRISVTLFEGGLDSFRPWLDVRLELAAGEGQRWREHRAASGRAGSWVPDRRCGRSDLLVHAGGRRPPAASGHLGGVMAVLGSLTLLAVMASFRVAGLRSLERKTPGSSGR